MGLERSPPSRQQRSSSSRTPSAGQRAPVARNPTQLSGILICWLTADFPSSKAAAAAAPTRATETPTTIEPTKSKSRTRTSPSGGGEPSGVRSSLGSAAHSCWQPRRPRTKGSRTEATPANRRAATADQWPSMMVVMRPPEGVKAATIARESCRRARTLSRDKRI